MHQLSTHHILWRDDELPISSLFDDPYYSIANGLEETRHVFLQGNELNKRFVHAERFHIAELGFGTGLNFLSAYRLFTQTAPLNARLTYTSFELYPLSKNDMTKALLPWDELEPERSAFLAKWPEEKLTTDYSHKVQACELNLIIGDANQRAPQIENTIDAWFLDGFSPAKNPELWNREILQTVFEKTKPGGTFATYSAAGWVREILSDVGFDVMRIPGYGRKKHMCIGVKNA